MKNVHYYCLLLLLVAIEFFCFLWVISTSSNIKDVRLGKPHRCICPLGRKCVGVTSRSIVRQLVVIYNKLEYVALYRETPNERQLYQITHIIRQLDPKYVNDSAPTYPTDVYSELYLGQEIGWVSVNSSYAKPLSELVEVLLYYPTCNVSQISEVLRGVRRESDTVKVHVAVSDAENGLCLRVETQFSGVNVTIVSHQNSPGLIWNNLVSAISTPYTFIGRNLDNFVGEFSSLQRLIRVLETVKNVQVVGGAVRNKSGHWRVGCFQAEVLNYALTYKDGYLVSKNECMFCDYLLGPFVARTSFLQEEPFNDSLPAAVIFEDWFLQFRISQSYVMNCPDVMFSASDPDAEKKAVDFEAWLPLARKWELNRISWPQSETLVFSCEDSEMSCNHIFQLTKHYLIPPCCMDKMATHLRDIHQIFLNHSAFYEIYSGSVLGAVKMGDFLPWDLDVDIVHNWNLKKRWRYAKRLFLKYGLTLGALNNPLSSKSFRRLFTSSDRNINGGLYFELWSPYVIVDRKALFKRHSRETMVNIHGVWVHGPPNPGLYARWRYGKEMLKHAQSWRHERDSSEATAYSAGHFKPCPNPSHHSCLNQFPPDGSISFTTSL